LKSGIKPKFTEGIDMSEKNFKDDENSSKETSTSKENKNSNMLIKYASIAWAELGSIFTDIKNASQRVAEENTAAKEIVAVEEVPNQAKPSATEFFKKQINDFKSFWSYLNKKSKLFIFIATSLVVVNYLPDFGPAENFLEGKCGWDVKQLSSGSIKSCNPNNLIDSLDADDFMVTLFIFRKNNFNVHIRVHDSKPRDMNFNGQYRIEYHLISRNKMQTTENINGCLQTYEYKRSGSHVMRTTVKIVGDRCHRAQLRAFETDDGTKMKLIDNEM
jgi:hypothetical protein